MSKRQQRAAPQQNVDQLQLATERATEAAERLRLQTRNANAATKEARGVQAELRGLVEEAEPRIRRVFTEAVESYLPVYLDQLQPEVKKSWDSVVSAMSDKADQIAADMLHELQLMVNKVHHVSAGDVMGLVRGRTTNGRGRGGEQLYFTSAVPCPRCGATNNAHESDGPDGVGPRAGDVSMCLHCQRPSLFDEVNGSLVLRVPTDEEADRIRRDVTMRVRGRKW